MTEIEQKALALVNAERAQRGLMPVTLCWFQATVMFPVICRAIKQHEAFKREVSDAVEASMLSVEAEHRLRRFILPKPVDPLVEVLAANWVTATQVDADYIRAALAKRGLEVREIEG